MASRERLIADAPDDGETDDVAFMRVESPLPSNDITDTPASSMRERSRAQYATVPDEPEIEMDDLAVVDDRTLLEKLAAAQLLEPSPATPLRNDALRCIVSLVVALVALGLYLIAVHALQPPNVDSALAKLVMSKGMMDTSADVCTDPDRYMCGVYNDRYLQSSLFMETMLLISHRTERAGLFPVVPTAIPSTAELASLGIWGCAAVNILPDIEERTAVAVYFSSLSVDEPLRHPGGPVKVVAMPAWLPLPMQEVANVAWAHGGRVYWIGGSAVDDYVCIGNASDLWTVGSPYETLLGYYDAPNLVLKPDIRPLLNQVRRLLVASIQDASFVSTAEGRRAYSDRVNSVEIVYGSGTTVYAPACALGTPLVECRIARWAAGMHALEERTAVNASNSWPFHGMTVNAAYSPLSNRIYVPYGIAQLPFYDVAWPLWMQVGTLGGIVAHEIGHAIHGWSSQVPLSAADVVALDEYESCVLRDHNNSGSTRLVRTLDEDWADAVSLGAVGKSSHSTSDVFTLWLQTWCAAGQPAFSPVSRDAHATAWLRLTATAWATRAFYPAFKCPRNASDIC
jgi:hypothetical protein